MKKIAEKRGVDVVFEHVGSATWGKSVESLAAGAAGELNRVLKFVFRAAR